MSTLHCIGQCLVLMVIDELPLVISGQMSTKRDTGVLVVTRFNPNSTDTTSLAYQCSSAIVLKCYSARTWLYAKKRRGCTYNHKKRTCYIKQTTFDSALISVSTVHQSLSGFYFSFGSDFKILTN